MHFFSARVGVSPLLGPDSFSAASLKVTIVTDGSSKGPHLRNTPLERNCTSGLLGKFRVR